MRLLFIGVGFLGMRMMTAAALQSAGDPLTPMRATMATRVVRMTLTPLLGFGLWIFPDMGLAGFGMAMILAQITGAVMNFYALFAGTSRLHLSLRGYRIDPPLLWRLVKIGVPASVTSVQLSVSQIIMLAVVSPFGITAIGAYTLVQRAQQFANMGTMGLGQAAGVLVGQNLGAKRPERAKQTVLWAIAYSIALQGLFGLFLVAFPSLFVSVFNSDPDLLSLAETWLRIQVLGYLAMGTGLIFAQSFNTAGDTIPPAVVTVVTVWAVQLPLALILPDVGNLGPLGIAWAMVIGLSVRLLFYVPYFLSGRWLRVKVI
jgi:Na+-driven multidrug efflux pump